MKIIWYYANNTFDRATKKSLRRALKLARSHGEKIAAETGDPVIVAMSVAFNPLFTAYLGFYTGWMRAGYVHQGTTLDFTSCLEILKNEKLPDWELELRKVHRKGTPEYKAIFAGGFTSFRKGSYDDRLARLIAFKEAIEKDAALGPLKPLVDTFIDELSSKRSAQQRAEELVAKASADLEKSRVIVCKAMYKNLGLLMAHFSESPTDVQRFFDLALLRSHTNGEGENNEPVPDVFRVKSEETITVLEGGFDGNTLLTIMNTGVSLLLLYTTKLPGDPRPGRVVEVLPGEEVEVFASELGAETNLFLMCYNPDLNLTGEFGLLKGDEEEE
jgi:hypothetical protein